MPTKTRLDEAITKYKRFRVVQGVTQGTMRFDNSTLQALLKAAGSNLWMENVAGHHVVEALTILGQTNSARSMANRVYALRSFFKYCATTGRCMPRWHDPMEGIQIPRFQVVERPRLPVHLFPVVLDTAPNARDRALFAGALYLLSRANELCDIRVGDVNLNMRRVRVPVSKRKGRKQIASDLMPITREFDEELRQWLMTYQKHCGYLDPTWYLFPRLTRPLWEKGARSGQLTFNSGWEGFPSSQRLVPDMFTAQPHRIAVRTLTRVGFVTAEMVGEGMHTFRRGGARARFDALRQIGYDGALRQVQALLHHENSSMTEEYIGLTLDKLERDEALMGQDMYPQLNNPDVLNLADFRVDPYNPKTFETDLPGFKIRTA